MSASFEKPSEFSKIDSGNNLSEINNCGRIEVPRLITSVGALTLLTGSIAVSTGATKDLSWTFVGDHYHIEMYLDKAHSLPNMNAKTSVCQAQLFQCTSTLPREASPDRSTG